MKRYLALILLLILVGILGWVGYTRLQGNNQIELLKAGEINDTFLGCKEDADCVSVQSYRCDPCSCGIYINKRYESIYGAEVKNKCEGKTPQKVCLPRCANTKPVCVKNQCAAKILAE